MASVVDQDTWLMSTDISVAMFGHTAGEGPLIVGLAHGDYDSQEIEEYLEASAAWDEGDKVAQEHRRRKVRTLGMLPGFASNESLWDGAQKRVKLGFKLQIGETLKVWIYNFGAGTLTAGTTVKWAGTLWTRRM